MNNKGLNLELEDCIKLYEKFPKFVTIFDILFENTYYFTRQEILKSLTHNILLWKKFRKDVPLFVVMDNTKIGSDNYYYYHFKNLLPKHKIILSRNEIPNKQIEILHIDDWSLTGINMIKLFEPLIDNTYNRKDSTFIKLTCIIAISTNECNNAMYELSGIQNIEYDIYSNYNVENLEYILCKNLISDELINNFLREFLVNSEINVYPVQLEYKSTDIKSLDQSIYMKCSKNKDDLCQSHQIEKSNLTLMSYPQNIFKVKPIRKLSWYNLFNNKIISN
jgi:hypothetical protein